MSEKMIKYLKIQIAMKKLTKEQVLAKYPELEGKI
jgi:hypothetical protein